MKDRFDESGTRLSERIPAFLRPGDQKTVAVISIGVAVLIAGTTFWSSWQTGGLVHIDQLPRNEFTFQVDVNQADWTELSVLPNIGEKTAKKIVEFRERHGAFTSLQSVTLVDGIGPLTIKAIEPFVAELPQSNELIADSK